MLFTESDRVVSAPMSSSINTIDEKTATQKQRANYWIREGTLSETCAGKISDYVTESISICRLSGFTTIVLKEEKMRAPIPNPAIMMPDTRPLYLGKALKPI